ncbi:response regulator transcription factor [Carbonactinospora thermoautotrophica]|uniref:response regulator transcription factor n=1 Tax=Carbonactinospora thermoautotrophica TaxID=1469144 RepID=UPI00226E00D3|nr:response regulator transcription factor [Carbonactinospora thermoautotrophica]
MAPLTLLIADTDDEQACRLAAKLREHHIHAEVCADGAEALLQVGTLQPDVLLMRAHLPLIGGATLVHVLRRHRDLPIIIGLGAGDETAEVTKALAAGATACVAHPYQLHQLLLILQAIRSGAAVPPDLGDPILEAAGIQLNTANLEVRYQGRRIPMPLQEFKLLRFLMLNADKVVTRQQIRDAVWGPNYRGETNTLTVHIRRLRTRLGDDQDRPRLIQTVRGLGYRLVVPDNGPGQFAPQS